jgi:hypothetical protein
MPHIQIAKFVRVLTRCVEVVNEPNVSPVVTEVYKASAEQPVTAFLTATDAVDKANRLCDKERREAEEALKEVDSPYKLARSSIVAVIKGTNLPATLKAQSTDTDKLNAIEKIFGILKEHEGQPWANALLQGDFGVKGAKAIKELNESIAAGKALHKAQLVRAQLFAPTYEVYLQFKCVIRDSFGSTSRQYRRVHLRASPAAENKSNATIAVPTEGVIPVSTPVETPRDGKGNVG